jgi:electron transfer flavoprotein alpha subunit
VIVVFVEHEAGRPERTSLEALAVVRHLIDDGAPGPIETVLVGDGAEAAARFLAPQGVSTAHVVSHPSLGGYAPAAWAAAVAELMGARVASAVVASGTDRGNEIMAYVAARTGLPLATNCLAVAPAGADGSLALTRQRWAGSLIEEARLSASIALLTVAPHAVADEDADASGAPKIEAFTPTLSKSDLRSRVVGRIEPETGKVSLAEARVVVGGGRGVGSAEGFADLEELALLLGGAVGVSRVVTSAGWRPHAEQVGQTGLRIAPDLYVACGISGAIQHIVGCQAAKVILAINKDAEAPIMQRARYAVIGDLHSVVPAISAEIRKITHAG